VDLSRALEVAIAAARGAGDHLRADFHRPGGPRGHGDKADADLEAEQMIRHALLAAFPDWGYLGEETGAAAGPSGAPVWLVDPNDGTREYLKGRRGSSVSIGLLVERRPALGVVHPFGYPDDRGELFAWAEGCGPMRRGGAIVEARLPERLGPDDVVLLSGGADRDPEMNLRACAPARYRPVPSIAHRLALVAAGEAAATVSLFAPGSWDYAAGHALLRASGAVLLDDRGAPVAYEADGASRTPRAFAGREGVARALQAQAWTPTTRRAADERDGPIRLRRGEAIADAGRLARAQGCLLGQLAGDSLGSLVEFKGAAEIASLYGDGPRRLEDGGVWQTLAGQPTDDSEMALSLARAIVEGGGFDAVRTIEAYRRWYRSAPFDIGTTTRTALSGYVVGDSQANGSLMRASPLGIFAHALPADRAAALARADSELTHPHAVCRDAAAAFVVAVSHAVREGDGPEAAYAAALGWARDAGAAREVVETLEAARHAAPVCDGESQGWVRIALQNAFHELVHAPSLEQGVVSSVRRGGDTDTNAAIAGALLGAVHGRDAVPAQWRRAILSCRPHELRARRPRPMAYWPAFALELSERLLVAGRSAVA
jgi:ADP-ribosylglycohydrolase/fructose-1,6-bisphosphatase/inositol monophosphatase family enzyme